MSLLVTVTEYVTLCPRFALGLAGDIVTVGLAAMHAPVPYSTFTVNAPLVGLVVSMETPVYGILPESRKNGIQPIICNNRRGVTHAG